MPQNDEILCFFMPKSVKFYAKFYASVLNFMIILCQTYCDMFNSALQSLIKANKTTPKELLNLHGYVWHITEQNYNKVILANK